jgi:PDZ domain-containing secreted protein
MKQFLALLYLVCTLQFVFGEQEPKRMTRMFNADDAVIIREIGAVIVPKGDNLVVDIILGNEEKINTDIQKDDAVLMANGKNLKSLKDLREQYESAEVGDGFKLGLKRGENLLIASFIKKSEEELNKAGGGRMMIRMEPKEGEEVLPALGLRVMTKNHNVIVSGTLPTISNNFKSFVPKENDIIVSINGAAVVTADEFDEIYTGLSEGENVAIEFSRDGKKSKETFSKPKPMGRMMIKK